MSSLQINYSTPDQLEIWSQMKCDFDKENKNKTRWVSRKKDDKLFKWLVINCRIISQTSCFHDQPFTLSSKYFPFVLLRRSFNCLRATWRNMI